MRQANILGLLQKYKNIPNERFFNEIFEKEEYKDILSKKADIVLDIGACAGEFSAYIYDRAEIIYAFEPNPSHYIELQENTKEFNLYKIVLTNLAISDKNGFAYLSQNKGRGGESIIDANYENEKIIVPTETLASFILRNKIDMVDILKIDIEGHEERVFTSPDFYLVSEKIKCIIGEHLNSRCDEILKKYGFTGTKVNTINMLYVKS